MERQINLNKQKNLHKKKNFLFHNYADKLLLDHQTKVKQNIDNKKQNKKLSLSSKKNLCVDFGNKNLINNQNEMMSGNRDTPQQSEKSQISQGRWLPKITKKMCVNFNNQRLDSDNERFANFDKMILENNRTIYQKSNKIISSIHCSDSGNGRSDKDESRFYKSSESQSNSVSNSSNKDSESEKGNEKFGQKFGYNNRFKKVESSQSFQSQLFNQVHDRGFQFNID